MDIYGSVTSNHKDVFKPSPPVFVSQVSFAMQVVYHLRVTIDDYNDNKVSSNNENRPLLDFIFVQILHGGILFQSVHTITFL